MRASRGSLRKMYRYVDVSCVRGLLSFRLMDFLNSAGIPDLKPDQLFLKARASCRRLYGEGYPSEEVQDDLENYRALELIHKEYLFRHRIWQLAEAQTQGNLDFDDAEAIWDDLNAIQEVRVKCMMQLACRGRLILSIEL